MFNGAKYEKEYLKKTLSGRQYTVVNLAPVLKLEEKIQAENEAKSRLYNIFKKYVWNLIWSHEQSGETK